MRARWAVPFSLLVIVSGAALVCPGGGETPSSESSQAVPPRVEAIPVFEDEGTAGLTLEGRVLDPAGAPLGGAEVHLAATADPDEHAEACPICGEELPACGMPPSLHRLSEAWERGVTPARSVRTDAQGRYRFEGLRRASVAVWAEAEGYGAVVRERAAPGEPVALQLVALRTLTGAVWSEDGSALPGARVVVRSQVPVRQAVSAGRDGVFSLPVGDGPFDVIATAPGHAPAQVTQVSPSAEPVSLRLVRLRAVDVVVFRDGVPADAEVRVVADHVERTARTDGGLVRVGELPVREVRVLAHAGGLAASATVALKEDVTRAELHLTAGGFVAITVIDPAGQPVTSPTASLDSREEELISTRGETGARLVLGPVPVGQYQLVVGGEGFDSRYLELAVGPGERSLDVVLQPLTAIQGRVVDIYGRPAPGVMVSVSPVGEDATSAADGTFRIEVPMAGVYSLAAHHSDWGGTQQRISAPASGVELTLEPQGTLRAIVVFEGRPVEGASLTMATGDNAFSSDRPSGAGGEAVMRGLPAGTYLVRAGHPKHLPSRPQRVEISDGATAEVTVELQPGAAITGTVRDERGAPISGASVSLSPPLVDPAETDADGRFSLGPLRPGYTLRAAVGHPEHGAVFEVPMTAGGAPAEVVLVRAQPHFGRVVSSAGHAITEFSVNGRLLRSPDGRFEVPLAEDQAPGEQREILVMAPGHQPQTLRPSAGMRALGTITLEPSPQLLGRVVDANGAPQAGVDVTCAECAHGALTDEGGRFTLDLSDAGPVGHTDRVQVFARFGSASGRAALSPGIAGDIALSPGGLIAVRVFDAAGRPAAGAAVYCVGLEGEEQRTLVTGPDGVAEAELPAGPLGLSLGERQPLLHVVVGSGRREVSLGAWPGSGSLTVTGGRGVGVLQLHRGELSEAALPSSWPVDGFVMRHPRGFARFLGVAPGRYTLLALRRGQITVHPVTIGPGDQTLQLP